MQITLSAGRTLEQKRALYKRPQDAWINLVEVAKENWSFGEGVASYAPAEEQPA